MTHIDMVNPIHEDHSHHAEHMAVDCNGKLNRAFRIGIWLNIIYVAIEAVFGFTTDSMGLLSDAGHNLSDVASLIIALIAFNAAKRQPNDRYTYGYQRATVNASVLNAIILYIAVAFILYESIKKLINPTEVDGAVIAWVAGIGVIINGITAWLFMKDSKKDLNIKGAYLHMAADTLVSVGVVASGIIISLTGWDFIDPAIGIIIACIIAIISYSMLRDSLRLAMDGVPSDIDINKIREAVSDVPNVVSYHHLHVWALSTTQVAMTVHVVVDKAGDIDGVIDAVRNAVVPLGVSHSTIEAETICVPGPGCNRQTPAKNP